MTTTCVTPETVSRPTQAIRLAGPGRGAVLCDTELVLLGNF
jgi:hypothetical protein